MPETPEHTAEDVAFYYRASLESVTLVNELVAQATHTDDEVDTLRRNVEHLELMLAKDWWTDEDLTPFEASVAAGRSALSSFGA
jgi:hypothetical protein